MEIPGLRPLYRWTMNLAAHRHAAWALFGVSFADSSFFPIPPDVLLIAMVLARREKAWWYAWVCLAGSILGAAAGYAIGFYLYETVGAWLVHFYHAEAEYAGVSAMYEHYGVWFVAAFAFTPLPYKIITIASGALHYAFWPFILVSILGRGARFFIVAWLLKRYGARIEVLIDKYLGPLSLAFLALLVGAFVLLGMAF